MTTCTLVFSKSGGHAIAESKQWKEIFTNLVRAAKSQKFNKHPWLPVEGTTYPEEYDPTDDEPIREVVKTVKDYGKLSLRRGSHFDHLYDRDHHINRMMAALETAVATDFQKRYHVVLYGPPGCGKSDILLSAGRMMGRENEAYFKFDATSTTQAMALDILLKSEYIPPVLLVEEIEKTDEKSLRWLLGLLDERGEVRKTNCRVGNKMRNVKMLCIATVNDMPLFKSVMYGALHSRFANRIYCPEPNREYMAKILRREVRDIGGNEAWVEPTLEFCMDDLGWHDTREIVPVCLLGRDKFLDGSHQRSVLATMDPHDATDPIRQMARKKYKVEIAAA